MLSTRAAHRLLADCTTDTGRRALARALGFTAPPHSLTARPLATLGFPANAPHLRVARITRDHSAALLLIEHTNATHWRDTLRKTAAALDKLTDARRWLILLHCADNGPVALATWLSSPRGPRLAVLTTTPHDILDSDAQTVAALATAWHPDPTTTCLRWHDLLGRHAIGKRFFRALETHVADIADAWPARVHDDDRRTLALIHVARLLFLKFLETKGWLDDDRTFLARHSESILDSGGRLWHRLLAPLTFGTLNTPRRHRAPAARAFGNIPFLNGGLFACSATEKRARRPPIHDDLLAPLLLDTLARFRFTAREDTRTWSEAAIDPDLLGKTFEALMDTDQRRGSGTFYTPATLVSSLVDDALQHTIRHHSPTARAALAGHPVAPHDAQEILQKLDSIRVLDPACGSGSILVATLERLATLRAQLGDTRTTSELRRHVLTHSIFGVDIAPMAVWLCELRLWLSVVIDDETSQSASITPLPNLDHHIRIGDALGNDAFNQHSAIKSARITELRARYARSAGARKYACANRIDAAERSSARDITTHAITLLQIERRDLLQLARAQTLFGTRQGLAAAQRRRLASIRDVLRQHRTTLRHLDDGGPVAFDFRSHFADAAAAGGFDLVIGNPPWVRSQHLDATTRSNLRTRFRTVTSHITASSAFGVQTDIAIPFTQRGLELTRPDGILAFLLPAKLWRSVSASALRHHLLQHATLLHLRDHSANAGGFSAAVYPSAIVMQRNASSSTTNTATSTATENARHQTPHAAATATPHAGTPPMHRSDVECHTTDALGSPHHFTVNSANLPATTNPGAPWRIVPDNVRLAADTVTRAGIRWTDTTLPPPSLGIKTGCNDAFLIADTDVPHALQPWTRPVLRGDHVRAWHPADCNTAIVIPCDADGHTLSRLTAPLARHFAPHERTLTARTDLRPRDPWWSIFRTDLLGSAGWRVIWADIGRTLRAMILPPHSTVVPLNSCYGVRLHDPVDAHALAALLNAPTSTAWLSLVAEPARGGYHRFLGWTVLALPMPDWKRAREILAPIAARARRGNAVSIELLHDATLEAYGIAHHDVAPLLSWTGDELRTERTATQRSVSQPTATTHTAAIRPGTTRTAS
jgi:N-6 DNA Methylase/Eco57I restriction-modification methylase